MWSPSLLMSTVVFWGIGSSIGIDDCPDNLPRDGYLTVHENKCYYFYLNIQKEYDEAQKVYCQSNGGNLASVKSSSVNKFLWGKLKDEFGFNGNVWIGLSDQDDEGKYVWRDGTSMHYDNFDESAGPHTGSGDFSGGYHDCVAMKSTDGKWTDLGCAYLLFVDRHQSFICEYSPKSSSENNIGPPATTDDCPATVPRNRYLKVLDHTCYYFYLYSKMEFPSAQTTCQQHGGNLVSIKTEKTQNFIHEALENTFGVNYYLWIGLKHADSDKEFVWRDGYGLDYENFANRQGSVARSTPDCVTIDASGGKWYSEQCTDSFFSYHRHNFICEFPATPRPTTTTMSTTKTTATITASATTSRNPGSKTTTIKNMSDATTATTATRESTFTTPTTSTTTTAPTIAPCPVCNLNCGNHGFTTDFIDGCIICTCLKE